LNFIHSFIEAGGSLDSLDWVVSWDVAVVDAGLRTCTCTSTRDLD
jgi:hypothetical protein